MKMTPNGCRGLGVHARIFWGIEGCLLIPCGLWLSGYQWSWQFSRKGIMLWPVPAEFIGDSTFVKKIYLFNGKCAWCIHYLDFGDLLQLNFGNLLQRDLGDQINQIPQNYKSQQMLLLLTVTEDGFMNITAPLRRWLRKMLMKGCHIWYFGSNEKWRWLAIIQETEAKIPFPKEWLLFPEEQNETKMRKERKILNFQRGTGFIWNTNTSKSDPPDHYDSLKSISWKIPQLPPPKIQQPPLWLMKQHAWQPWRPQSKGCSWTERVLKPTLPTAPKQGQPQNQEAQPTVWKTFLLSMGLARLFSSYIQRIIFFLFFLKFIRLGVWEQTLISF